jgi:hypothetical protein
LGWGGGTALYCAGEGGTAITNCYSGEGGTAITNCYAKEGGGGTALCCVREGGTAVTRRCTREEVGVSPVDAQGRKMGPAHAVVLGKGVVPPPPCYVGEEDADHATAMACGRTAHASTSFHCTPLDPFHPTE